MGASESSSRSVPTNWWRGLRRAVLLGLAWAVVWAPIAVIVGMVIIDPDNSHDEMWVAIGAYPGFLSAVIFCAALALAERSRRLSEVSPGRAGVWGALAGLVVGVFPFLILTPSPELSMGRLAAGAIGSITVMSVISAVVSVLVARTADRRAARRAGARLV